MQMIIILNYMKPYDCLGKKWLTSESNNPTSVKILQNQP